MILKRRTIDTLKTEQTTVISTGVQVTGTINGASNIILNGSLEGNIKLSGLLALGKSGKIHGQIDAANVIVEGDERHHYSYGKSRNTGRRKMQGRYFCSDDCNFREGIF